VEERLVEVLSPVESIEPDLRRAGPEEGIALCLSGGGYRAMLFHLGALWRLNEAGLLPRLARISSVSGGSIVAALLGLKWSRLEFGADAVAARFSAEVVFPIRDLAGRTVDEAAVIGGALLPGTISDRVARAYRRHLYGDATLQDLPDDPPRFVINATNVQSGALWRFMKPYMRDYRVGEVKKPKVPLAVAVAASSAFPPFLSPVSLEVDGSAYTAGSGQDLQRVPFTTDVVLTDGGVYDNLGLETAWKRYQTVLVSDGGGKMPEQAEPKRDWARHSYRVLELIDNQVRSLRKRQVIGSFEQGHRSGAYWGIRTDISHYGLVDVENAPIDRTRALADTPTRLKRLDSIVQERLINWGYAVCDAALRRHMASELEKRYGISLRKGAFPYENARI
jgi:NTE family protein